MAQVDPYAALANPYAPPTQPSASAPANDPYEAFSAPAMGVGEDMLRSGATGVMQGTNATFGTPALIASAVSHMPQAASDLVRAGLEKLGVHTAPFKAPDPLAVAANSGSIPAMLLRAAPSAQALDAKAQAAIGPYHQPQTKAGEYAQSVGQYVPAALTGGGGLSGKVLGAILPGIGSQASADIVNALRKDKTKPSPYEGAARFAGGAAGLMLGQGIGAVTQRTERMVAKAAPDVSPDKVEQAAALMRDMKARGVHITPAEAVQQTTGGATGLGRLQQVVESTKAGHDQLAPMFAERPQQVATAVSDFADTVAPPTAQPSVVGQNAKYAAGTALDNVRQGINARTEDLYSALPGQAMPDAVYKAVIASPGYHAALAEVRGNPILNASIKDLPDQSLAVVNEVNKRLGDLVDINKLAGEHQLASGYMGAKATADTAARELSKNLFGSEYGQAHDAQANLRALELDPLQAGPAGAISRTAEVPGQTAALYPSRPLEGAPAETATALRAMGTVDPRAGADLTRQHIMGTFNEAAQQNIPGENQWGGAKFAAQIAGNPEQRATLAAGLSELPNGPAKAEDMNRLLEGLFATGKRAAVGSMTAEKTAGQAALKSTSLGSFLRNGLNIAEPLNAVGRAVDAASYKARTDALVKFLKMHPDEFEQFMAKAAASGPVNTGVAPQLLLQAPASQIKGRQ